MKKRNTYENLFDEFLCLTDFALMKYNDGFGLWDLQGANLGNIESDRFETAEDIFNRMSVYIDDYFINDIDDLLDEQGIEITWDSTYEEYIKHAKPLLPRCEFSFDVLDMICYHANEINLENCEYKTGDDN